MLVDPPIAIVGLSNWVLDPAKMNRAVLVQRPEPSHADISQTGIPNCLRFLFWVFSALLSLFFFFFRWGNSGN